VLDKGTEEYLVCVLVSQEGVEEFVGENARYNIEAIEEEHERGTGFAQEILQHERARG